MQLSCNKYLFNFQFPYNVTTHAQQETMIQPNKASKANSKRKLIPVVMMMAWQIQFRDFQLPPAACHIAKIAKSSI